MSLYVKVTRPLTLARGDAFARREPFNFTLAPGVYPLEYAPHPVDGDAGAWLVLLDSDVGQAAGFWQDAEYQTLSGCEIFEA